MNLTAILTKRANLLKLCSRLFIIILLIGTVGLLIMVCQFNMTGYGYIPQLIPNFAENAKRHLANIAAVKKDENVVKETLKKTNIRTLIDVDKNKKLLKNETFYTRKVVSVLWFNKPVWIDLDFINNAMAAYCQWSNCVMTEDKTKIQDSDAIIFCLTQPLPITPPILAHERRTDQIWIFFSMESPINHIGISYRHNNWKGTMNWSMSYRTESDIFIPYGILQTRLNIPAKNYMKIFHSKTKFAAWFVSNCGAPSGRDEYVDKLRSYGIEVDVFGMCSDNVFRDLGELKAILQRDYKFYLSFENSLCTDYVTEKFFRYYDLDIVLVVRGGADYNRLLPNHTFIDTSKFSSVQSLAKYLLYVSSSAGAYEKYLRNKAMYTPKEMFSMHSPYCSVCEKLNNLEENRKTYEDHVSYIHSGSCWVAVDVLTVQVKVTMIICAVVTTIVLVIACRYANHCQSTKN